MSCARVVSVFSEALASSKSPCSRATRYSELATLLPLINPAIKEMRPRDADVRPRERIGPAEVRLRSTSGRAWRPSAI
jgi:hypothetical protein